MFCKENCLRIIISIFLLFVLALRTAMPIVDYAVNYNYISSQLCENRDKPQLLCNGKCYLKKEILKSTENQNTKEFKIQITAIDVFVVNETLDFKTDFLIRESQKDNFQNQFNLIVEPYCEDFFHPPLS